MSLLGHFLVLLLAVSIVDAQKGGKVAETGGKRLQPWLVGLIAVVVFLFIVFVLMIISKVWCHKDREMEDGDHDTHAVCIDEQENESRVKTTNF
nr:PREDICTED: small integral membrane protein 24 [Latimeria chalumnae]|eukprot:XP_005999544.1 PREDICTED: small integral membrane protein 24 [Latimeria chalumnae]